MSCACDEVRCPAPLTIAAGLATLPRAPGAFPDWRLNLLAAIGRQPALDGWRAREPGDLGLMLVEMCAYVLDVGSFYDQLTANESYLRTSALTGTARRHIDLLGYLPRPAFGASVWLAAKADGVRTITLPAGTAIRSGAFEGQPPQIFELTSDAIIEPRVNAFTIDRVPVTKLPSLAASLPVESGTLRALAGDLLVLASGTALLATYVSGTARMALRISKPVSEIRFASPLTPPAGATYAGARLLKAGARCGAWKQAPASGEPAVLSGAELSLDAKITLQPGDVVAIEAGGTVAAARIVSVSDVRYTVIPSLESKITDKDGNVSTLVSPPIKTAVTRIKLDANLPFSAADLATLVVHYAMGDAAILHAPLKDTLDQGDPISIPRLIDPPRTPINRVALQDVHGDGVITTGTLDAVAHSAALSDDPVWGASLWAPVQLCGNVVGATRGETVRGELLGVGDASQPRQTFRLAKSPLTYLAAANAAGRVSTLVIHVGGIRWDEADSFYGARDDSRVYIVRHDDEGHADITFGGGARLPTNAAVVADYRFGAGAAAPPADSAKQVARPVAGLNSVTNVLPAYGGADAEGSSELTIRGPRSALLLGRAVSLVDIEVAAARQPGVRAAKASWRWDSLGLRPAAVVSYVGDPQLATAIRAAVRALAEEDAPIAVKSAPGDGARLDVDIAADPRRVSDDVAAAVGAALFAPVTLPGSGGLLRPERLGPDGILFQSEVVRTILDVPGVAELRGLSIDGAPFTDIARAPAAGAYLDFEVGGVWVNGKKST